MAYGAKRMAVAAAYQRNVVAAYGAWRNSWQHRGYRRNSGICGSISSICMAYRGNVEMTSAASSAYRRGEIHVWRRHQQHQRNRQQAAAENNVSAKRHHRRK